jgi:hypothetical protein
MAQTSSLLHILGSDLFHGAFDGEGGNDEGAGPAGSSRAVGRLDELNGSVYVAPGDRRSGASLDKRSLAGQAPLTAGGCAQVPFQAHGAGGRVGYGQGASDAPRRGGHRGYDRGYDYSAEAAARAPVGEHGKGGAVMTNGTHGHWMPEHGSVPVNYRGRGQGPQGIAGPRRGSGQWQGHAPPYGGGGGRGGSMTAHYVSHVRGGGPDVSGGAGGPVWKPFAGAGAAGGAAGRGADMRSPQLSATKGPRTPMQSMQQLHQPSLNGRADAMMPPVAQLQQIHADINTDAVSMAMPPAAAEDVSGHVLGSASTVDAEQAEAAEDDSTSGASAAEKEAADKARREAKKKIKKEKQRKSKVEKEDQTPSSSCTPVQGTPDIAAEAAEAAPEQPPPMSISSNAAQDQAIVANAANSTPDPAPSKCTAGAEDSARDSAGAEAEALVAKEKGKGVGAAANLTSTAKLPQALPGGALGEKEKEKNAKVTPPAAKKQKETANRKSQQQQKNQNAQVLPLGPLARFGTLPEII